MKKKDYHKNSKALGIRFPLALLARIEAARNGRVKRTLNAWVIKACMEKLAK